MIRGELQAWGAPTCTQARHGSLPAHSQGVWGSRVPQPGPASTACPRARQLGAGSCPGEKLAVSKQPLS